ncbi:CPBP family glutamic-type intramembrane protease [Pontibacter rugosus]|uniref:Type II CAAX prenyl endopeptidase Rce1 family protein n=1 Tax=Pontibacter rugosus TaxID=1745966 RepID=A0ABW3SLR1_9BACT
MEFISLAISTLTFALVHSSSNTYIMFMLVPGVLLAVLYLVFKRKNQSSFWIVYVAHACINMFTLLHNRLN